MIMKTPGVKDRENPESNVAFVTWRPLALTLKVRATPEHSYFHAVCEESKRLRPEHGR